MTIYPAVRRMRMDTASRMTSKSPHRASTASNSRAHPPTHRHPPTNAHTHTHTTYPHLHTQVRPAHADVNVPIIQHASSYFVPPMGAWLLDTVVDNSVLSSVVFRE
eukprot:GHVU01161034.1.p1 GENE.GHVU01161034.1~~GHVU01161034.1.p1  ORF type:complete len:106 (-),score=1.83 GHVU01161034.1:142-459(-)